MDIRKRLFSSFAAIALAFTAAAPCAVKAEEDEDFSDTAYWNSLCTGQQELSEEQKESCTAYMNYMQGQNQMLQSQIAEIDARKEDISKNIAAYSQQISGFNSQIAGINSIIEDLNLQIKAIEEQIDDINLRIEENEIATAEKEQEIERLKQKVGSRMEEQQKTMRLNQMIDILFGASSFDSFIRLANGLSDIYERDSYTLSELNRNIEELEAIKQQLLEDQANIQQMEGDLEKGKQAVNSQQAALLSAKYELEVIRTEYNRQLASADSEALAARDAMNANKNAIGEISASINATPKPSADSSSSSAAEQAEEDTNQPSVSESSSAAEETAVSAPSSSGSDENPYYGGYANCTWTCWQLVHDTLGISLPAWGNAGEWLGNAAASGYATGSSPSVYSIMVFSSHVAFVTQINGDQVYIKEGNYLGDYNERWVPASGTTYSGQTCIGYIYL